MEGKMENVTDSTVNLAHQFTNAKELVNEAVENGRHKVERTLKRAFISAEDCVEDTTHYIKKNPWQSVACAVGIGAFVGILAGWQAGRCCERTLTH